MNKMKRIISLLLTVCFILGAMAGLGSVGVSAAETTGSNEKEIDLSAINYTLERYYTPEDKLATMTMAFEKGDYQLWVNSFTGEVTTVNSKTGEMLFSNPYDVGLSKAVTTVKNDMLSQIILGYTSNESTVINTFNSYVDAALNNQIKVKNIKNGIRVEYTIGREETNYLVPRLIPADRFEQFFGESMRQVMAEEGREWYYEKRFMTYFQLRDPAAVADSDRKLAELYATLPITQKIGAVWQVNEEVTAAELMQLEEYIKTYVPSYTYEELDIDHSKTEYVSEDKNPPVFKMALEYTLDELGMRVTLPANGIRFDESLYQLSYVTILPYMGAGNYSDTMPNTGYTFLPDGSGAIFRFEDLANGGTVSGQVYGQDYAYHTITGKYQEVFRMPVYGIVRDNLYSYSKNEANNTYVLTENETPTSSGFFAIIEEGDALATIKSYHLGKSAEYHTTQVTVNPRPSDSYNLADSISVGENSTWTVVSERKYVGNYTIRYIMLTDDEVAAEKGITDYYPASYFGMAMAYQDYLTSPYSTGTQNEAPEKQSSVLERLESHKIESTIPLYIETFGAIDTVEKILSVPVNVMAPLTTFDDIVTMYEEMAEYGDITNINFKLTGYANGGMYSTVPYGLKWEKSVGGKKGFEELLAYAADVNKSTTDGEALGIFPDFDFVYIDTFGSFDGFSLDKHAVKTIDNRYTVKSVYSSTIQTHDRYGDFLISPAYFSRFYEKLTKNYLKYIDEKDGVTALNISAATLGMDLNSDFDEDEPYNREDNKEFTIEALQYLSDNYNQVMVNGGNSYTWQYVDHIVGLSIDSSRYLMASNNIPFTGIVLHGYLQYTGTAINEEGNLQYGVLKAIESGSSLYFILTYQNATKLKEDVLLSQNYSVRYDIWAGSYNEEGEFETGELVELYHQLNDAIADVQDKRIIGHTMLDGWRVPDADELEADAKAAEEAAILAEEQAKIAEAARLRREHLEARVSVVDNARIVYDNAMVRMASVQLETVLKNIENALNKIENAKEAIKNATEDDDIAAFEKVISDAERSIRTMYETNIVAVYNVVEDSYETILDKQRILEESLEFFSNNEYAEEFIADVEANKEPLMAIVADMTAAMESIVDAQEQVIEAAKGYIVVEEEEEEVVEEEFLPAKYKLEDGSIVAVTYGEEGEPYKTFLLNYNYFDIIVEYEGTNYEIDAYGYAVLTH